MRLRLSAYIFLCLLSSCKDKESIFKNYEYCTLLKESVICTDFKLPETAPVTCNFVDKATGNYICPIAYAYGFNASPAKDFTDARIKAMGLEKDFRKTKRDLLLCRGL